MLAVLHLVVRSDCLCVTLWSPRCAWSTFVVVLSMCLLVLQALRLFPAVVIVPTMQISWTLFSVVSGGIYYQEYHAFTPFTASMFGLGILVSLMSKLMTLVCCVTFLDGGGPLVLLICGRVLKT